MLSQDIEATETIGSTENASTIAARIATLEEEELMIGCEPPILTGVTRVGGLFGVPDAGMRASRLRVFPSLLLPLDRVDQRR